MVTAIDTSGRAVLFAGSTVIIALLGMLAIRLSFISGLGIGSAVGRRADGRRRGHAVARGARLRRHQCRQAPPPVGPQRRRRHPRDGVAPLEPVRTEPRVGADDRRPPGGARAGGAGAVAATRLRRRRQRCGRHPDPPGLRPPRAGIRARLQRPVRARDPDAGRREPRGGSRPVAVRDRGDPGRRVGLARDHERHRHRGRAPRVAHDRTARRGDLEPPASPAPGRHPPSDRGHWHQGLRGRVRRAHRRLRRRCSVSGCSCSSSW